MKAGIIMVASLVVTTIFSVKHLYYHRTAAKKNDVPRQSLPKEPTGKKSAEALRRVETMPKILPLPRDSGMRLERSNAFVARNNEVAYAQSKANSALEKAGNELLRCARALDAAELELCAETAKLNAEEVNLSAEFALLCVEEAKQIAGAMTRKSRDAHYEAEIIVQEGNRILREVDAKKQALDEMLQNTKAMVWNFNIVLRQAILDSQKFTKFVEKIRWMESNIGEIRRAASNLTQSASNVEQHVSKQKQVAGRIQRYTIVYVEKTADSMVQRIAAIIKQIIQKANALIQDADDELCRANEQLENADVELQRIGETPSAAEVELCANDAELCIEEAKIGVDEAKQIVDDVRMIAGVVMQILCEASVKAAKETVQNAKEMLQSGDRIMQQIRAFTRRIEEKEQRRGEMQRIAKTGIYGFNKIVDDIEKELQEVLSEEQKAGEAVNLVVRKGLGNTVRTYKLNDARQCIDKMVKKVKDIVELANQMRKIVNEQMEIAENDEIKNTDMHKLRSTIIMEMEERADELEQRVCKTTQRASELVETVYC